MIEGPECQCDIRSLNNFSGAMLEWYKGKRRGVVTMQGGTVPCLALLAVTSIYLLNAATLIWGNQNTTKRIKTRSKNTTKRIKTTESGRIRLKNLESLSLRQRPRVENHNSLLGQGWSVENYPRFFFGRAAMSWELPSITSFLGLSSRTCNFTNKLRAY